MARLALGAWIPVVNVKSHVMGIWSADLLYFKTSDKMKLDKRIGPKLVGKNWLYSSWAYNLI